MVNIMPPSPLAYEGDVSVPYLVRAGAPQVSNTQFIVPTIWIDKTNGVPYIFLGAVFGWFTIGVSAGSAITPNAFLVGGPSNTIVSTAAAINGQIPIGRTGLAPVAANITAGTGISITNGSGSITIASSATGIMWQVVTGDASLASNNGYITNSAGLITITLPPSSSVGDTIYVQGLGSGGWLIAQNASQLIHLGAVVTTTGVAGSLASTNRYDAIAIVCAVANTEWLAISSIGNITVV